MLIKNNSGVTSFAIMLLALLVLTVVLVNGIAISVRQDKQAKNSIKTSAEITAYYCFNPYQIFPEQCKISQVFKCDNEYILRTECIGVGDVIIDNQGVYKNWCGYTSLEGQAPDCGEYWIDSNGDICTESNNLCLNI